MTLWARVALAMVPLAVASVGTAGLSAAYFGGGRQEPWTLLAACVFAVLLALFVASRMARQLSRLFAAEAERQQAAHQALVASEENAQAIIKTALDAFFQTDLDGVIVEWGPQAEALTGWARAEAIGL